ncbi:carboxyltransferase domain-containing protein [Kocuria soli]|uniref:Carboxyltransferase domain-containing protein n=1 Tax=Kocuria soli TaxID=2485125 RepID=A0A3N3ZR76_9MICC|nr:carboxyltransferase domain-containing protein [Kocuria soli]ROZ61937.1 carboxyltransferase domain-containing protein [Kocuria soli]
MRFLRASDTALLVEVEDPMEVTRLGAAWSEVPGVTELIPGAQTVLVRFDPSRFSDAQLVDALSTARTGAHSSVAGPEVSIPVRYDGEDLDEVADLLSVSVDTLIERHLNAQWRVAFCGFAPGFGYATCTDPLFDVPRRSSPRTRVPAGAVGLAGPFTSVYPRDSPGGWQLIGHTDAVMWDIDRDPPALVAPGTVITFEQQRPVAVVTSTPNTSGRTGELFDGLEDDPVASEVGGPASGSGPEVTVRETWRPDPVLASLRVIHPGIRALIQDGGRPGHAAMGVSGAGAADRTALSQANRAVGNLPTAAVLECTGAVHMEYRGLPGVAAVAGAQGTGELVSSDGTVRPILQGVPFAIDDGDELSLSHPTHGLRYVIAVRGGLLARPALGSVSSDTLAGLGPGPLEAGDCVVVGDPRHAPAVVEPLGITRDLPRSGETVDVMITLGPRDDWFTPEAVAALTAQEWLVGTRSDRVGLRLEGTVPLDRRIEGELPSEGTVTGAIQVPPDGQPVLFLPDHPLTGGYPVIGAVVAEHLDLVGQLPPGARIRFRLRPEENFGG